MQKSMSMGWDGNPKEETRRELRVVRAALADEVLFFSPSNPKGIRILDHTPSSVEDMLKSMQTSGERSAFMISSGVTRVTVEQDIEWDDHLSGARLGWNVTDETSYLVNDDEFLVHIDNYTCSPRRIKTIYVSDKTFKRIQEQIAKNELIKYNEREYLIIDLGTKLKRSTSANINNIDKKGIRSQNKHTDLNRMKAISRWEKYKESLETKKNNKKIPTDNVPDNFDKSPKKRR